jgi:magnesium transporter
VPAITCPYNPAEFTAVGLLVALHCPIAKRLALTVHAIEFDFTTRVERVVAITDVPASLDQGHSVWVDIDLSQPDEVASVLQMLQLNSQVIRAVVEERIAGRYDVHDDCIHASVFVTRYVDRKLSFDILELILAQRLIITLHHGRTPFIEQLADNGLKFFQKFALSIGFLLFEIWDSAIDHLRRSVAAIEVDVDQTQQSIFSQPSDDIFQNVSQLSGNVLELRKLTLVMRDSLDQLATHTSEFVPATAQPYLMNLVGSLERLAGDLTVERETLAESLTLYLGMVSHRTNQLIRRLTLVSLVFLPLTFLCGLYGTNFDLPEYSWPYGNVFIWSLVSLCATSVVVWMRAKRMW